MTALSFYLHLLELVACYDCMAFMNHQNKLENTHHTVECDVALNVKCFHSLSTSFSDLDYQTKEDKINQYDKA